MSNTVDQQGRKAAIVQIELNNRQIQELFRESEKLANEFGVQFYFNFDNRSHWFKPTKPLHIDDVEGTDWEESSYEEYDGWQNSSSNC